MTPTTYPEINAVLEGLCASAQRVLAARFVGVYLYGSLASGDFDLQRSDIDFVAVTTEALPLTVVVELKTMHQRLRASGRPWAAKLEGTYIPQAVLRRYDPSAAPCPCLNEGKFYLAPHGSDWIIQRHILRECGVVVTGPTLAPLIDPVSPADLRQAVRGILREWWRPMLDNPAWLRDDEYLAYAVLTMCRARHTLQHGTVVSKPAAARWAQAALPAQWSALIAWAIALTPAPSSDLHSQTLSFIQYTLDSAQTE